MVYKFCAACYIRIILEKWIVVYKICFKIRKENIKNVQINIAHVPY